MSDTAHERAVKRQAEALAELRKMLLVASESTPLGRRLGGALVDVKRACALLDIIGKAADECAETLTEYVGSYNDECDRSRKLDAYADDLRELLDTAVADRKALLQRLGMTDAQWSAAGGACESDFDAPATPTEG